MMKHKGRLRKYFADYKFNSLFFRNLLMLAGLALLLGTLALYNKPFEDPKKR